MGFPSPADDYAQARLDPTEYLVRHPAATYFMRAETSCMARAGIQRGDVLVVDRSLCPKHGSIVVAAVDGEFHVRRLSIRNGQYSLVAADGRSKPIDVQTEDGTIWGVVTFSIHSTLAL